MDTFKIGDHVFYCGVENVIESINNDGSYNLILFNNMMDILPCRSLGVDAKAIKPINITLTK